jgi:hypothetical protein
VGVAVLDRDAVAALVQPLAEQLDDCAGAVLASAAAHRDAARPGGQLGVRGQVVDQLGGAGGGEHHLLHAPVAAIQVEDACGDRRVTQPLAHVLDPVGRRRDLAWLVQVAEGDEGDLAGSAGGVDGGGVRDRHDVSPKDGRGVVRRGSCTPAPPSRPRVGGLERARSARCTGQ